MAYAIKNRKICITLMQCKEFSGLGDDSIID